MNGMKSQPPEPASKPTSPQITGKYLIIGVFAVALAAAAAAWVARYNATHRVAKFFGPTHVRLIREAPIVEDYGETIRQISTAPGLLHLRTALLEDRSYNWPPKPYSPDMTWDHALIFRGIGDNAPLYVMFSADFKWMSVLDSGLMLSCEPIAKGLCEMFAEFSAKPAANTAEPSR
jgi:hypothetical protein